jgi:hypothetical protein
MRSSVMDLDLDEDMDLDAAFDIYEDALGNLAAKWLPYADPNSQAQYQSITNAKQKRKFLQQLIKQLRASGVRPGHSQVTASTSSLASPQLLAQTAMPSMQSPYGLVGPQAFPTNPFIGINMSGPISPYPMTGPVSVMPGALVGPPNIVSAQAICNAAGGNRALPYIQAAVASRSIAVPVEGTEVVTLTGITTLTTQDYYSILNAAMIASQGDSNKVSVQSLPYAGVDLIAALSVPVVVNVFGALISLSAAEQVWSRMPVIVSVFFEGAIQMKFKITSGRSRAQFFVFAAGSSGGLGQIQSANDFSAQLLAADNPGLAVSLANGFPAGPSLEAESFNMRDIQTMVFGGGGR